MPDLTNLAKAELRELDADFEDEINSDSWTTVQFNPETLKVSFSNQVVTPAGGGDQNGTPSMQFVGAGTTKLSLQLWFDITTPDLDDEHRVNDVRKLTQKVAYFITPQETDDEPPKFVPPAVRFLWGSFQFDGLMDSLEESLEFFSNEGIPLRASMTLSLSQQKIQKFTFRRSGSPLGGRSGIGGRPPGTTPLVQISAGVTLQGLADSQGKGANWQAIATANGIENPRLPSPGLLVNLNVSSSQQ